MSTQATTGSNAKPGGALPGAVALLGWILAALVPVYAWTVWKAPLDDVQGVMQRILYVHPPLA